ncbi:MAG: hypothetical protein KJ907_07085 [Actinobacteria bacterium]|nr:hypothetical protein [Planctomycetota bacterium]MBU4402484.1 hypothetical protein [Actinomycetota bacterium]MBU4442101.1 hypothetical protein [Actinomycetota bacterium]
MVKPIKPGDICTVNQDIVIDGTLAFREGERVMVETVAPNPQMPEFKYTVYSPLHNLRYQLSDNNISPEATLEAAPAGGSVITPPKPPILAKKARGLSRNAKYVIAGAVALFVIVVIIVAIAGGFEQKEVAKKDEPATSTTEAEVGDVGKKDEPATDTTAPAATQPAPAPTPEPPATYTDEEIGQLIETAASGNVNIGSARIADGRAKGGERLAIITFVPEGPVGSEGYYQDLGLIWGYVIGAQNEMNADIDSVAVIVGDAAGNAVQTITLGVSDILAWYNGQISDEDFFSRWQVL